MPSTNPLTSFLGKLRDTAFGAVKGAATLGRSVVEGVGSKVAARVPGRPKPSPTRAAPVHETAPAPAPPVPAEEPRPHGDAVAPPRKAPTKIAPAKKASPRKTPAQKAASKAAPKKAPGKKASLAEPALRTEARDQVVHTTETPGAPAAPGDATPPPQPGEEPLIDPGTAKQIAKEADRGRRDADPS